METNQLKTCLQYQIILYWRSGKIKQKVHIKVRALLKILLSSILGFFIFRLLLIKTPNLGFNEQIFLLHGYLFIFFFMRSLHIHSAVFDNKKDKLFFLIKPIKNSTRALSVFLFTLYILCITILPAIISAVVIAALYWSIPKAIILFFSLTSVTLIGLSVSGFVFYIIKIFIKTDFFSVLMTIIRSCMNILICFLLNAAKYYKGPVQRIWYFLPATSNIIFFKNINSGNLIQIGLSFSYPFIMLLLYIILVKKNLTAQENKIIFVNKKEKTSLFDNISIKTSIVKLYKKIMAKDTMYKTPIYSAIGNLFSMPFFLTVYNLRFGTKGELFTFNMYFITILWCFLLLSVHFTEGSYSENPKAGWLIYILQSDINENKRIFNSIILKRIFIFAVVPLLLGIRFFIDFRTKYVYTVIILVLTFLTSFLLSINSNYKYAEPFSCEQDYKSSDDSVEIFGILLLLPLVYALYMLSEKYYVFKIVLPLFLLAVFAITFLRSVYGAKYIKNRWS